MSRLDQKIQLLLPNGDLVDTVIVTTSDGDRYAGELGTIRNNGANVVIAEKDPDEVIGRGQTNGSAGSVVDARDEDFDPEAAAAESEAEVEEMRKKRTREARGLDPDGDESVGEPPTAAVEGTPHRPAHGKPRRKSGRSGGDSGSGDDSD